MEKILKELKESIKDAVSMLISKRKYERTDLIDFNSKFSNVQEKIKACIEAGYEKEQIFECTKDMLVLFNTDLSNRMRHWPRGYPGDFTTIDYLYHNRNNYEQGTLPWLIEEYIYSLPIVIQHTNKIKFQSDLINKSISKNKKSKIAILACGGCIDLSLALDAVENSEAHIYINDQDPEAIEHSLAVCDRIKDKITTVKSDILIATKKLSKFKEFDLVLAGGVFDYIDDRKCNFITKNVHNTLLKVNGIFAFTNICKPNPYRYGMEYMLNWKLIERSEEDIKKICTFDGINDSILKFNRDPTNLTHLVELIRH